LEVEQHIAQWVIEEIKGEIKKFLEFNEKENNLSETMGQNKDSPKREYYGHILKTQKDFK
jgi:hypothetical protein